MTKKVASTIKGIISGITHIAIKPDVLPFFFALTPSLIESKTTIMNAMPI